MAATVVPRPVAKQMPQPGRFDGAAALELLKPITWFAPMWAFGCGIASSGAPVLAQWPLVLGGLLLCGPIVCGTSQAVNDWFDRHVDAINEPNRPIPSGRLPGRTGLAIAVVWTFASLGLATVLGAWVFWATLAGLALAWAYSAPPLRLKRNGWWGGAACAACYEGLPWVTGAAMLSGAAPANMVLAAAALYSFGAFGIMTLNDFKSVEGDRATGIDSLPVLLGVENAAQVACVIMAAPQVVVVAMLLQAGFVWQGGTVALLLAGQLALMARLLADPRARAPWYNATGTSLYVAGMMVTAFAISGVGGAP